MRTGRENHSKFKTFTITVNQITVSQVYQTLIAQWLILPQNALMRDCNGK